MENNEYKYTVVARCMTYNHAPYIEDALQGFAIQETTFPVAYIVMDDASTDGEPDVLRKWAEKHLQLGEAGVARRETLDYGELIVGNLNGKSNSLFVIVLLKENHYQKNKAKWPLIAEWNEKAKYYAVCEGDNYWIDPHKLETQVNFLERNPEYVFCHTDFDLSNGGFRNHKYSETSNDVYFSHFINNGSAGIGQLTAMYRVDTFRKLPRLWRGKGWPMTDMPLQLEMSRLGKFKYLPKVTAIYRTLTESASHGSIEKELKFLECGREICKFYATHYEEPVANNCYTKVFFISAMKIAFKHSDKEVAERYKKMAVEKDLSSLKMLVFYYATKFACFGKMLRKLRRDW